MLLGRRTSSLVAIALSISLGACARNLGALVRTGPDDPGERIVGIYPCEAGQPEEVSVDPHRPLTVLVHGCGSSGERFGLLARSFEARGQQAICFHYNDRDFLNTSATQLAIALGALERRIEPGPITLLGHSQGGLVARRAVQSDLPRGLETRDGFTYRLVTVSSPFHGIASSADCGLPWLHALSFTVTLGVCMAITGNKWTEIPPGSSFMSNPAPLVEAVTGHLQILTDERTSCRRYAPGGRCEEDDLVFTPDEQRSSVVETDPRVQVVTVHSGHAAIVGETGDVPRVLLRTLESYGVLAEVPEERAAAIEEQLALVYAGRAGGPGAPLPQGVRDVPR
jgi:pimeloyl-ACP methyl ester carboxylesterase